MSSFEQHPSEFQPHPSELEAKSPEKQGALGSFQQSSLGSLSQSVRSKNLKSARVALVIAFIVLLVQAGLEYATLGIQADEIVRKELAPLPPGAVAAKDIQERKDAIIRAASLICIGIVGMALIFLVLAILVKRYPLFCTVGGLILYIGYCLIIAFLIVMGGEGEGESIFKALYAGILWKVIIIVGLVKGIRSAVAYHHEQEIVQGNPA